MKVIIKIDSVNINNADLEIKIRRIIKAIMKIIKIIIETNCKSNNDYYDNGDRRNYKYLWGGK